jgi:hypothetical protein
VTESEQGGARFEITGVEKGAWPIRALYSAGLLKPIIYCEFQ